MVCCIICSTLTNCYGNFSSRSTIKFNSAGIENAFGISKSISGLGIIILLGLIIFGGIKRISSFAELIVPFMRLVYINGTGYYSCKY
ncbi:alanine:cation symporter family protein [Paraclostridium bifermentans]|nr:alanine:cation symporter family protein [Paraclostridium bifermentans]